MMITRDGRRTEVDKISVAIGLSRNKHRTQRCGPQGLRIISWDGVIWEIKHRTLGCVRPQERSPG